MSLSYDAMVAQLAALDEPKEWYDGGHGYLHGISYSMVSDMIDFINGLPPEYFPPEWPIPSGP